MSILTNPSTQTDGGICRRTLKRLFFIVAPAKQIRHTNLVGKAKNGYYTSLTPSSTACLTLRSIKRENIMEDILDIDQLAVLMGDSVDIIERNMKQNPIQVPPLIYVRGNPALKRWRLDTVEAWVRGREAGRSSTKR